MVEDRLDAHRVQQLVESLGGEPLERGVGVARAAHAVDHVAALAVAQQHLGNLGHIVLPVTVQGHGDVAVSTALHEPA